ncbi:MAG: hypothetical protein WKF79_00240 [Nocardioides sp.]
MNTRPAFDAASYETPELAALNLPLHGLGWDMIEAERALTALNGAPRAEWDAQFAVVTAARAAHAAALETCDAEVAAYCERADAAEAAAAAAVTVAAREAEPALF